MEGVWDLREFKVVVNDWSCSKTCCLKSLKVDTKYIISWIKKIFFGLIQRLSCSWLSSCRNLRWFLVTHCIKWLYIADVQRFWMLSQGVTTSLTLGTPPAAESPTVPQSTPTIQNPTPSHQRPTKDRWLEHQVSQKFLLSCENYDHATRVLKCFDIRRHDDQHIFDQI